MKLLYNDVPVDVLAKDCVKCRWEQLLDAFPVAPRNADGRGNKCKICVKDEHLQAKHGITIEDYNETLDMQGKACADCRSKVTDRALSVQTSPKDGINRWKLVCNRCLIRPGTGPWYVHHQHPAGYQGVIRL